jgi:cyclic pyranopterin phosphate synthase
MPKSVFNSSYEFISREDLLSFEEIRRSAELFSRLGVRKLRLTGGEPLIRPNLEDLIRDLNQLPLIEDICLTTNAALLTRARADSLKQAGLQRINISLDALDDATFMKINDVRFPVQRVLDGIDNARAAGLPNLKVNMVVQKGINEHSILPMARYFHDSGHVLRFIEFMDVGQSNDWQLDQVVSSQDIVEMINAEMPIEAMGAKVPGEVAKRWRYRDGRGEIGLISSVTQPFCRDCNRIRLSANGKLHTCLVATHGHDLRSRLRSGADDAALSEFLKAIWEKRGDRYSELRSEKTRSLKKIEMSYIGG